MCIHICMYEYVYIHIKIYVCMNIYVCIYMYEYVCVCVCVWIYMCIHTHTYTHTHTHIHIHGLPWWLSGKEFVCQCRKLGFIPWVRKISWRRKWQPTPIFLLGKSHGQRSLAGFNLRGHKRDMTGWLHSNNTHTHVCACECIITESTCCIPKTLWINHTWIKDI